MEESERRALRAPAQRRHWKEKRVARRQLEAAPGWFAEAQPQAGQLQIPFGIERAADFRRDLDLALHAATSNQCGIEFAEDIGEWQTDQNTVAVVLGGKDVGRSLAEFTKRHLHRAS